MTWRQLETSQQCTSVKILAWSQRMNHFFVLLFGSIIDVAKVSNTFTAGELITVAALTGLLLWLLVPAVLMFGVIWLPLITVPTVELSFLTAVPITLPGLMMVVPVELDGVNITVPVALGFWTVTVVGLGLKLVVVEGGRDTRMMGVAVACEEIREIN